MLLKTLVLTVCLFKFTLTESLDSCDGNNIEDTTGPMKSMRRSSSINGKKFVVVDMEKANWFRADNICRYNSMQLAVINSPEEQKLVTNLIDRSPNSAGYGKNGFWISGNDLACQGNWYWSTNGNRIKYSDWKAGEPNNFKDSNERCIHLDTKVNNYEWNDSPCDNLFFFICEERGKK